MRNLKSRLLLGMVVCAALMLALASGLWLNTERMLARSDEMHAASQLLAHQGRADMAHDALKAEVMHEVVRRMHSPAAPSRAADFTRHATLLRSALETIARQHHEPEVARAAADALPLARHFIVAGKQILDTPGATPSGSALAVFERDYALLVHHLARIGVLTEAHIQGIALAAARTAATARLGALIAVVIAVVGIAVLWLPIRHVLARLRALLASLVLVSRDHTDLTGRVDVGGAADEVGDAAGAFNRHLESLRTTIGDISLATARLHTSVGSVSNLAREAHARTEATTGQLAMISHAVEALDGSDRQVAEHARQSARSTSSTGSLTMDGERVVHQSITAMNDLAANVDHAMRTIRQLSQESDRVGSVVQVISDITEQTNLLALNAAIEAARAGENGRGFAVVAGEVRSLAGRTRESTAEITRIIGRLQMQVRQVVADMETGLETTRACQTHASAAGEAFGQIRAAIADMAALNLLVSGGAEAQSLAASGIDDRMREVHGLARDTHAIALRIMEAASTATTVAEGLEGTVTRFRTTSAVVELF